MPVPSAPISVASPPSKLSWGKSFAHSKLTQLKSPRNLSAVVAAARSGNVVQRLGRVLKEKAEADLDRIFKGTNKTRQRLGVVEELFTYWNLEEYEENLEELEDALISADFGPKTALKVVEIVRERVMDGEIKSGGDMRAALKQSIREIFDARGGETELQLGVSRPSVVLVLGVNGGGKTTTVGKLAHKFGQEDLRVLVAPGDTFRAAAAEQLAEWANRSGALMGAFEEGAPPEDVLSRSVSEAVTDEGVDVVICDTSGRLHNNFKLMDELVRCRKSVAEACGGAPHEVLLVLDGTTGLNMVNQAREFTDAVSVTGIVLTKLDGTARGGAVVSVVDELGIPVKFVGLGETVDDLHPFDSEWFVEALFPKAQD
uniref:Fused signal recognition particle receptor n=1 Tax=Tetraselmis sp. GSL018 TaxID=582737 RepID=A0A061RVJ5_9CHLO